MAGQTIDELQIKLVSDSSDAVASISSLINTLERLNNVSLDKFYSNFKRAIAAPSEFDRESEKAISGLIRKYNLGEVEAQKFAESMRAAFESMKSGGVAFAPVHEAVQLLIKDGRVLATTLEEVLELREYISSQRGISIGWSQEQFGDRQTAERMRKVVNSSWSFGNGPNGLDGILSELDERFKWLQIDTSNSADAFEKLYAVLNSGRPALLDYKQAVNELGTDAGGDVSTEIIRLNEALGKDPGMIAQKTQTIRPFSESMAELSASLKAGNLTELGNVANYLERISKVDMTNVAGNIKPMAEALQTVAFDPTVGEGVRAVADGMVKLQRVKVPVQFGETVKKMFSAFEGMRINADMLASLKELVRVLNQIGGKKVAANMANMPVVAKGIELLMQTLARAPTISENTLQALRAISTINPSAMKAATGIGKLEEHTKRAANATMLFGRAARTGAINMHSLTSRLAFAIGRYRQIYFVVRRIVRFFSKMVQSAMDYVEVLNYFNAAFEQVAARSGEIFGDAGQEAGEAFTNRFAAEAEKLTEKMSGYTVTASGMVENTMGTTLGMNPATMMNYQAVFAQMASSMGVSSDMAVDLSRALTEIGADLASVKNMDFEQTWKNLQSGLVGMSRAVDKYGLNIRNVNLQQKLMDLGIDANIQEMNQQDKALLRTIIILENSQYAWGDLADTLEQPANQMRMLKSGVANLGRTIGNVLLPIVSAALPYINAFVVALQKMFETLVNIIGFDFDWGSAGGAAIDSEWADYLDETAEGYEAVAEAAEEYKNQILGFDEINKLGNESSDSGDDAGSNPLVTGALEAALQAALEAYQRVWDQSYENVSNRVNEMAAAIVAAFEEGDYTAIGEKISGWITDGLNKIDWDKVKGFAYNIGAGVAQFLNGAITPEEFEAVGRTIAEAINSYIQRNLGFAENFDWGNFGRSLGRGLSTFLTTFDFKSLVKAFNAFAIGIAGAIGTALREIEFTQILCNIIDALFELDPLALTLVVGAVSFKFLAQSVAGLASTALSSIVGALAKVPGLGTVALVAGGIALYVAMKISAKRAETEELANQLAPATTALDGIIRDMQAFARESEELVNNAAVRGDWLVDTADRYYELSKKVNRTVDEQRELERLAEALVRENPAFLRHIDDQTKAWTGTRDILDAVVRKTREYYIVQATESMKEELYIKSTTAELKLLQAQEEQRALQNEYYSAQRRYDALTNIQMTRQLTQAEEDSMNAAWDTMQRLKGPLDEVNSRVSTYQAEWEEVVGQINAIDRYADQLIRDINNVGSGIKKGTENNTKIAASSGRILAGSLVTSFENTLEIKSPSKVMERMGGYIVQGLANGLSNTSALTSPLQTLYNKITGIFSYDSVRGGLNGIVNAFSNAFASAGQASIEQYNRTVDKLNTASVNGNKVMNLSKVPMLYANGGFPEDGFFWANSNELVGGFTNGRTAVANNAQIIEGIEGGVARGMMAALMSSGTVSGGTNGQPIQVTINVDSETLYRTTLRGQDKYNSRYHINVR